jgi:hypothetical protein
LGLGILLDDVFAWLVIGIGAGFILMGFIAALGKLLHRRRAVAAAPSPAGAGILS